MKATGIIRRIDELGRIVIPKEIRKNFRISEGENIEIYIDENENIVLKKYSSLKNLNDFAQSYIDSVSLYLKKNILISDMNSFVAVNGDLKKDILSSNISEEILSLILKRNFIINKKKEFLKLTDSKVYNYFYILSPIFCHGDICGSVIILSFDEFTDLDEKIAKITSLFLSKYLEA